MKFFNDVSNLNEITENPSKERLSYDAEVQNKYNELMEDDVIDNSEELDTVHMTAAEIHDKYISLFEQGDFFTDLEYDETEQAPAQSMNFVDTNKYNENSESNTAEIFENSNESKDIIIKDDNGTDFIKNGELISNNKYTINENNTYQTDEHGRIKTFDSTPAYTDDGDRNLKEQKEIGGEERLPNDDGGHLIARILGGSEGIENLVPMRSTINRGDYKKMENEIASALKDGKEVSIHGDLEHEGDSQRPSSICVEYHIDDKKTIVSFDNKENSTQLLDTLKDNISIQDFDSLSDEIEDMKADNHEVSITSIKTDFDEYGNESKFTVGMLDESTAEKTYKVYYLNKEE